MPGEGYFSFDEGIVIANSGEWIHRAVFLADLQVTVQGQSTTSFSAKNILATTFFNEKKKGSIGVTVGRQLVTMRGTRLAKPAYPRESRQFARYTKYSFGYKYDGKTMDAYFKDRKVGDSTALSKFTRGFDTGHAGLAWNGTVQSFIFTITLTGALDPDWVAKALGETGKKRRR